MEDKILFVMGNGPSLGEIMNNPEYLKILKENHTFGLNAAYRAYEEYDFYPTYFGCFDCRVNVSHKESFSDLVLSDNNIKEFFFVGDGGKKQRLYRDEVYNNDRFIKFNFITGVMNNFKLSEGLDRYYDPGSSGSNALHIGILKGYKKIVLLGCDCNYVERVDGAVSESVEHQLILTKDLDHNPNYWFNGYQKTGDRFNLPQTDKFQMKSWENMSKNIPSDVEVLNCSDISKIPYFNKVKFEEIIK